MLISYFNMAVISSWIAGHLKVCTSYTCISLKLYLIDFLPGDNSWVSLPLHSNIVQVFDALPQSLSNDHYYLPLSTNFLGIDALTKEMALQYSVHPVIGVKVIPQLALFYPLAPGKTMHLLFIVPEPISGEFRKQTILTADSNVPLVFPHIHQYVAGLSLNIKAKETLPCRVVFNSKQNQKFRFHEPHI